jgi:hypothetical protein
MLTRACEGPKTLARLKKAASLYSGREKEGVHEIATSNLSAVDVEIAINAISLAHVEKNLPRMDLASLERGKDGVDLVFWEAKTFDNPELESDKIVDQIRAYRAVVDADQADIAESYAWIAKNLSDMAKWSNGVRGVAPAINDAATGARINVSSSNIGLLVYDFTAHQRDRKGGDGKTLHETLTESFTRNGLGTDRFRFKGKAKGLRI